MIDSVIAITSCAVYSVT